MRSKYKLKRARQNRIKKIVDLGNKHRERFLEDATLCGEQAINYVRGAVSDGLGVAASALSELSDHVRPPREVAIFNFGETIVEHTTGGEFPRI